MRYAAAILILAISLCARVGLAQTVNDATLAVDHIITGLDSPTGMAFMPNGDAFVIEKQTGKVELLKGRTLANVPVLDLDVANDSEEGLLSIALHPNFSSNGFAYLYYTQSDSDGGFAMANRIDRFHWDGSKLTFDRHIKELPVSPGTESQWRQNCFWPR
jgi:glucose/arabinose dehydrogenase